MPLFDVQSKEISGVLTCAAPIILRSNREIEQMMTLPGFQDNNRSPNADDSITPVTRLIKANKTRTRLLYPDIIYDKFTLVDVTALCITHFLC